MAEDKARDRVPSCDSARERNAVIRPQGPAVARMDFSNGLVGYVCSPRLDWLIDRIDRSRAEFRDRPLTVCGFTRFERHQDRGRMRL